MADHPKRPAKHRWLGELLLHQQPNTAWALQTALIFFAFLFIELISFIKVLSLTVWQIPTYYAPVRH